MDAVSSYPQLLHTTSTSRPQTPSTFPSITSFSNQAFNPPKRFGQNDRTVMRSSRYASTRQKSCQQCSSSKARCDRRQAGCSRCDQRGLACSYPQPKQSSELRSSTSIPSPGSDFSTSFIATDSLVPASASLGTRQTVTASNAGAGITGEDALPQHALQFHQLSLTCPIEVEKIQNRWLNPYFAEADQSVKHYPDMVSHFIHRILKSYAAMAARGRAILPFIHATQMGAPGSHLATCLSLARVSDNPLPGSEDAAAAILQREMATIAAQDQEHRDDLTTLAAFQAYLIYILILFFRLNQGPNPFFRSAMMTLQNLACVAARKGLVCVAETTHTRPRWEEWIITETKRRTLYVMYLLDNVLSTQENLPTYLGTELRGLPAPSNKALWHAPNRGAWEKEYNIYLAEWSDQGLTIDELWPIPPELDDAGLVRRRERVDHWLENLDEFGTMIFTVTGCTHGG